MRNVCADGGGGAKIQGHNFVGVGIQSHAKANTIAGSPLGRVRRAGCRLRECPDRPADSSSDTSIDLRRRVLSRAGFQLLPVMIRDNLVAISLIVSVCSVAPLSAGQQMTNASDPGTTPLLRAAYQDNLDLVDKLLRAGADPRAPNQLGVTALSLACCAGKPPHR